MANLHCSVVSQPYLAWAVILSNEVGAE